MTRLTPGLRRPEGLDRPAGDVELLDGDGGLARYRLVLDAPDVEQGGYRNHFHAVAASTPLQPRFIRKPSAPGLQTALVVGLANESLTTDRDLRVKLQFPWQRGERPLAGGLTAPDNGHHAPGDERSGTWVRVGQPSAGANWGSVFVPRIGTEVAIQFIEADIDRPVIAGQLHNGQDRPPFAAGVDSGVNHPELALGHLIAQGEGSAWRGAGLLAYTQGWATLRAGAGLLVSTAARPGTYASAEGTQMDAAEALAQLNAGRDLGRRLGQAAQAGQAQALPSHDDAQALDRAAQAMDPQRDGRHPGPVNGQAAFKPDGDGRPPGSEPVETVARPQVVLHSASTQAWASPGSLMAWAGQAASWVTQGELHQAAAHTYAQVSGKGSSLFTHQGGAKLIAANGPVSVRAHTDALQLWADQSITLVSVNDEIRIQAQTRIALIGGKSSLVLDGANITFTCPGLFDAQGSQHAFEGGANNTFSSSDLPVGAVSPVEPPEISLLPAEPGQYSERLTAASPCDGEAAPLAYTLIDGADTLSKAATTSDGFSSRHVQDDNAPAAQALLGASGAWAADVQFDTGPSISPTLPQPHEVQSDHVACAFGSASQVVQFVVGGELRFAYNAAGKLTELGVKGLSFLVKPNGQVLFGQCRRRPRRPFEHADFNQPGSFLRVGERSLGGWLKLPDPCSSRACCFATPFATGCALG